MRYWEDLELGSGGQSRETHTVTAEQIKRFATEFDPLPFHLDEAAGAASAMGSLCASSLHTMALCAKLCHTIPSVEETAVLGGVGWEEARFPLPVIPGDVLHVRTRLIEKRPSRSNPERGLTVTLVETLKQDGSVVASYKQVTLMQRRPQAER